MRSKLRILLVIYSSSRLHSLLYLQINFDPIGDVIVENIPR